MKYNLKESDENLKSVVEHDEYVRFPQELKDKYELSGDAPGQFTDASAPLTEELPEPDEAAPLTEVPAVDLPEQEEVPTEKPAAAKRSKK